MNAPAAAAITRTPWDDARAKHPPGTRLLRIIDLKAMTQRFDVLPPAEEDLLDGCTLIMPRLARNSEELALIIDVYDRLWFEAPPDK